MSRPSSMMRPAVGLSTPVSRLITVVLPAPFGPISAWRAPFSTASETSCAATMPPKRFSRPMVSRIAIVQGPSGAALPSAAGRGDKPRADATEGVAHRFVRRADPVAADQHDDHQHKPDPELPVLRRQRRDPVLQEFVDHRADQAAIEIAGAADDQHEKKIGGAIEREHVKRAERGGLGEQRAGDAGKSGAKSYRSPPSAISPECRPLRRAARCL